MSLQKGKQATAIGINALCFVVVPESLIACVTHVGTIDYQPLRKWDSIIFLTNALRKLSLICHPLIFLDFLAQTDVAHETYVADFSFYFISFKR